MTATQKSLISADMSHGFRIVLHDEGSYAASRLSARKHSRRGLGGGRSRLSGVGTGWPPFIIKSGFIGAVTHASLCGPHLRSGRPCLGSAQWQQECPEEFVLGPADNPALPHQRE